MAECQRAARHLSRAPLPPPAASATRRPMTRLAPSQSDDTASGFGFALGAYVLWGFLPLYLRALGHVPPAEIVAHRILWSVPVAATVLRGGKRVPLKLPMQ